MSKQMPLTDALTFLRALNDERAAPDDALARLSQLKTAHPDVRFDLLWQEEPVAKRFTFDLLLTEPESGTVSLSLTPDDGVPLPLLGAQRWKEMEVVRVDGRSLWMYEAAPLLDAFWDESRIHRRILDFCILRRELENSPDAVPLSDADLKRAVDDFRRERGLEDEEATKRWLTENGLTLGGLEHWLEHLHDIRGVRQRAIGARAEAVFNEAPGRFDRIWLVAFPTKHAADAVAEIRRGAAFYSVAERALAQSKDRQRSSRSILFETMFRTDVVSSEPLEEGSVVVADLGGAGPYVVAIRGIEPATWDAPTRDHVEEKLFAEWLSERRARAHVVWNWGTGNIDED